METVQPITGSQVRNDFIEAGVYALLHAGNDELDAVWNEANDAATHISLDLEYGFNEHAATESKRYYSILNNAKRMVRK